MAVRCWGWGLAITVFEILGGFGSIILGMKVALILGSIARWVRCDRFVVDVRFLPIGNARSMLIESGVSSNSASRKLGSCRHQS